MNRQQQTEESEFRGLSSVRVSRDELLKKVRENRDGHRVIFEEALEGWHTTVTEALASMLKDARAGKKYTPYFSIPEPQDHTREYDRVIGMLEMSKDEELVLSASDFAMYAQDDFGWKNDFLTTASNYGSGTATMNLRNG